MHSAGERQRVIDTTMHITRERQSRISGKIGEGATRKVGSGGEDRTPDLGIMRPSLYH